MDGASQVDTAVEVPVDYDFGKEVVKLQKYLFAIALKWTYNPDKAADLVQDTNVRMLEYQSHFRPGTNLKAWAAVIMRNAYFTASRKRKFRQDPIGDEIFTYIPDPKNWDPAWAVDLHRALECIPKMSLEHQAAVVRILIWGETYEEAAKAENIVIGTLKSRVFRGRNEILDMLDPQQQVRPEAREKIFRHKPKRNGRYKRFKVE